MSHLDPPAERDAGGTPPRSKNAQAPKPTPNPTSQDPVTPKRTSSTKTSSGPTDAPASVSSTEQAKSNKSQPQTSYASAASEKNNINQSREHKTKISDKSIIKFIPEYLTDPLIENHIVLETGHKHYQFIVNSPNSNDIVTINRNQAINGINSRIQTLCSLYEETSGEQIKDISGEELSDRADTLLKGGNNTKKEYEELMLYIGLKSLNIKETCFKKNSSSDIKPSYNNPIHDTFFMVFANSAIFAALSKTHKNNIQELTNIWITKETAFITSGKINFNIKELNPKKVTQDYQLILLELVIKSYDNITGSFDVLNDILDGHKYTVLKDFQHTPSKYTLDESIDHRIHMAEFQPEVSQFLIKLYKDPADEGYLPPTTITTVGGKPVSLEQLKLNRARISLRILNHISRCTFCNRSDHNNMSCTVVCARCLLRGHLKHECGSSNQTVMEIKEKKLKAERARNRKRARDAIVLEAYMKHFAPPATKAARTEVDSDGFQTVSAKTKGQPSPKQNTSKDTQKKTNPYEAIAKEGESNEHKDDDQVIEEQFVEEQVVGEQVVEEQVVGEQVVEEQAPLLQPALAIHPSKGAEMTTSIHHIDWDQEMEPQDFDMEANPSPNESPSHDLTELQGHLAQRLRSQKKGSQANIPGSLFSYLNNHQLPTLPPHIHHLITNLRLPEGQAPTVDQPTDSNSGSPNLTITTTNVQNLFKNTKGSRRIRNVLFNELHNHFHVHQASSTQSLPTPRLHSSSPEFDPHLMNSNLVLLQESSFNSDAEMSSFLEDLARNNVYTLIPNTDHKRRSRILVNHRLGMTLLLQDLLKPCFDSIGPSERADTYSDCLLRTGNTCLLVISLYLPSGKTTSILNHLFKLLVSLENFNRLYPDHGIDIVFGGDLNCIFAGEDSTSNSKPRSLPHFQAIIQLLSQISKTSDSFGHCKHGNKDISRYTNNNNGVSATRRRLDYLFIPDRFLSDQTVYHRSLQTFPGSTHNSVSVMTALESSAVPHCNQTTQEKPYYFNNHMFRFSTFSKAVKDTSVFTTSLLQDLSSFKRLDSLLPEYIRVMREIQDTFHLSRKLESDSHTTTTKSNSIRSSLIYTQWSVLNKLFKKQQQDGSISVADMNSFIGERDESTDQTTDRYLSHLSAFYEDLYSSPATNSSEYFLRDFPLTINRTEYGDLSRPISTEELKESLATLSKKSTSPGKDGLSYLLLREHFDEWSQILQGVGNQIMATGTLPESLREVIMIVIPKKQFHRSKNIQDLRPISLNSCILKLISHVFNRRLLKVADRLVHFNQVGFLNNRQMENLNLDYSTIYSNALESFELEPLGTDQPSAAMVTLDFQKAFDRLSHCFILDVLKHYQMPQGFINAMKAMISGQRARIRLNHRLSSPFPLDAGVRQGSPISPTLFILCLEPLLFRLRRNLEGVSLKHQLRQHKLVGLNLNLVSTLILPPSTGNTTVTMAYADDLSVFLKDKQDTTKMLKLLSEFAAASNMKLNEQKTELLYLSPRRFKHFTSPARGERNQVAHVIKDSQNIAVTIQEYASISCHGIFLDDLDKLPKILGHYLHEVNWAEKVNSVKQQIYFPLIDHVPFQTRSKGVNVYAYTKLFFYDPVFPMGKSDISKIEAAVNAKLKGVSMKTLTTPQRLGGFGLLNLSQQLIGHRGKFIFNLFTEPNYVTYRWLRFKLQNYCLALTYILKLSPEAIRYTDRYTDKKIGFPWFNLLDGTLLRHYNSLPTSSELKQSLHPDLRSIQCPTMMSFFDIIIDHLAFDSVFKIRLKDWFSAREIVWLRAWFQVVPYPQLSTSNTLELFHLSAAKISHRFVFNCKRSKVVVKQLTDHMNQELSADSFKQFYKKLHERTSMPIMRPHDPLLSQYHKKRWIKYWYHLYRLQIRKPGLLETLHLFILGIYDHKFEPSPHSPDLPNLSRKKCHLCDVGEDTPDHLFNACATAHYLWTSLLHHDTWAPEISIATIKSLDTHPEETMVNMNNYLHTLLHLRNQRKCSSE
ncbi:hypothetical protein WICPIJ_001546, partial [Wickerhamomyces pijperi]